jgi:hypothetical protein
MWAAERDVCGIIVGVQGERYGWAGEFLACLEDPNGDFAAVGDEYA